MKPDTAPSDGDVRALRAELARLQDELLAIEGQLTEKTAELEQLAYYDTLTGLYNRRCILEKLNEWLRHVRRYHVPLSIVMLDIDYFKHVNDAHGHRVGDRVLAELADFMRRSVRQTDLVGRYGGEEFLILLPRTDATGAVKMARRVCRALRAAPLHDAGGGALKVTASLGAAEYCEGDDEDSLISRADAALYRAKEAGRDRVELAACT